MKKSTMLFKSAILTVILVGLGFTSYATAYTAVTSGNWTNAATWGATGPSVNVTTADAIVIPIGITVTLDANVVINNATATLAIAGSLTGSLNLSITAGTLSGAGTVTANRLTVGAAGLVTSTGAIAVNQFANSALALSLTTPVTIADSVILYAGVVNLGAGAVASLGNNVTINLAGGTIAATTGIVTLAGSYNLLYTGTASAVGLESTLTGLQNVTVNLASSTGQLVLSAPLAVSGALTLTQGRLVLGGNTLTINGTVTTAANAAISGSATSAIIVNGTGASNSLALATTGTGSTLQNLTLNIGSAGSLMLGSAVTVVGALSLNNGTLNLNGNNLTIGGTISAAGTGALRGSTSSNIIVTGTGSVGTLVFATGGNTIGGITVNSSSAAVIMLGSDMLVSGTTTLSGGSLNLNGYNLTLTGAVNTTGTGSITGNAGSNITLNGAGNAGILIFASGSQTINNLTMNVTSSGFVALESDVNIRGRLTLTNGTVNIGTHNIVIAATGSIQGGSSASYIVTNDTGTVSMTIANAGAVAKYQVGTMTSYAPVTITNNSTASGTFTVNSHPGVFAHGTSGLDLSATQSVVNTSWNIESSLTSGANVDLSMQWSAALQVNGFNPALSYVSHYTGGMWNTQTPTAAILVGGAYSLALTGVTSFSPFAVFDRNTSTGIADIRNQKTLNIYPNPSNTFIHLANIEENTTYHLSIYDMTGQLILDQDASSNQLNISKLNDGIYAISINQNGNNFVSRMVVSK